MAPPLIHHVPVESISTLELPSLKIKSDHDLEIWKSTLGYKNYLVWVGTLRDAVVGVSSPSDENRVHDSVRKSIELLNTIEIWIDQIPPQPTPQRFGNLAFRSWGHRLESEYVNLLQTLLPPQMHHAIPYLSPYLLTAFGSFTRMDYGTGHETAFAIFLYALSVIRFFPFPLSTATTTSPTEDLHLARTLTLVLWPRYIKLTWHLQDTYRLEPAGSHGVWGLDDSHFLGYLWGSAQMCSPESPPPSSILSILSPPTQTQTHPETLYHSHLLRILQTKTGPFHEHSSQLYSILTQVQSWKKICLGLSRMYVGEVLGKRVVVQHLEMGGLVIWDEKEEEQGSSNAAKIGTRAPSGWSTNSSSVVTARALPDTRSPRLPEDGGGR